MIEYQGWATIREAYREEDEDDAALAGIAAQLEARVAELAGRDWCACTFRNINGAWRLSVMGNRNHASGDWPEVLALFEWIAREAPGSYGLLSCHDDENAQGRDNEFQVFVLRRGTLSQSHDPHLSPYLPMVEEPSPGSPYFSETLDQALIREVVVPMGLRALGKRRYALDMFRDYRLELEVGEAFAFEGEEPEVSVYLSLHCPRYGTTMDAPTARYPGMTWDLSRVRRKGVWGDVLRLGQVTFYRHEGRFCVTSFKDHENTLREKRFDVRDHLEHLRAMERPKAFLDEYCFGLSGQVLATLDKLWPHIFLGLECEMSPAAVIDLFESDDFATIRKTWRLKAPLDTVIVKDMMDVYAGWDD
jgi:hypothetical protein